MYSSVKKTSAKIYMINYTCITVINVPCDLI